MKKNIILSVINTKQNEYLLKFVPHRDFLNLSVVYCEVLEKKGFGFLKSIITFEQMEEMPLNEDELHQLAEKNTLTEFPFEKISLTEIMIETIKKDENYTSRYTPEELEDLISEIKSEKAEPMQVISNEKRFLAASVLAMPNELSKIAEEIKCDFIILPSSIHEIIIISMNELPGTLDECVSEFSETVKSTNYMQVALQDQLSNQVYYFDKKTKKLSILTKNDEELISERY